MSFYCGYTERKVVMGYQWVCLDKGCLYALSIAGGVLLKHTSISTGASMVFLPGAAVVEDRVVSVEGIEPSDHLGITWDKRVQLLEDHMETLQHLNRSQDEAHKKELAEKDARYDELYKQNAVLAYELAGLKAQQAQGGLSVADKKGGFLSFLKPNVLIPGTDSFGPDGGPKSAK